MFENHAVPTTRSSSGARLKRGVRWTAGGYLLGVVMVVLAVVLSCSRPTAEGRLPAESWAPGPKPAASAAPSDALLVYQRRHPEAPMSGTTSTPPIVVSKPMPDFSGFGKARVGSYLLAAVIDAEGMAVDPVVLRGGDSRVTSLLLQAIRRWRFKPATEDGRPVAVIYLLNVNVE